MSILEDVKAKQKEAMKSKNTAMRDATRLISAMIHEKEIQARTKGKEITEDEVIAGLRSMIKSRRDSVKLYQEGGRPELADKETGEIAIIETFLPAGLSEDEIAKAVDEAISETGASSVKEMGKVMGKLKAKFGAALDMGIAGPLVKNKLS